MKISSIDRSRNCELLSLSDDHPQIGYLDIIGVTVNREGISEVYRTGIYIS